MELKTARLTVLLDPTRKQEFERVCRENDMTPSQVLRRLIRDYMEANASRAPAPVKRVKSR
jgi:antitoxin component of RelBE/YafQ-DinJ toxin-antitoxin module